MKEIIAKSVKCGNLIEHCLIRFNHEYFVQGSSLTFSTLKKSMDKKLPEYSFLQLFLHGNDFETTVENFIEEFEASKNRKKKN